MKNTVWLLIVLISGCANVPMQMYSGPERQASEHAVVSAQGVDAGNNLLITVMEVDGEQIDGIPKIGDILLLPGEYTFLILAERFRGGVVDYAKVITKFSVLAGHTYIPNTELVENKFRVWLDDKGEEYSRSCLPTYVHMISKIDDCEKEHRLKLMH